MIFEANDKETLLISIIQKYLRSEYCIIRMTKTMLDKSIIDASQSIRTILLEEGIVDYSELSQGEKSIKNVLVLNNNDLEERKVSYYRPETKMGDPRFWVYELKNVARVGDLIYFTVFQEKLLVITLKGGENFENIIKALFDGGDDESVLNELLEKIGVIKNKGWVLSANPNDSADKDVGETLERELNLTINNLRTADYKGAIEIKCKRLKSKTRSGLFAQVPNWDLSKYSSAVDFLLNYGIASPNHPEYKTLYVTVKRDPPNGQGFRFFLDESRECLVQLNVLARPSEEMCVWQYSNLRKRLFEKHPQTLWIVADEKMDAGQTFFRYTSIVLTKRPLFTQFLFLVDKSIITMDWTHRVLPNRTKYNDHGFLFKIGTKDRGKLFGESKELII